MIEYILQGFKSIINKEGIEIIHDENQYLNLIKFLLEKGTLVSGRNGNVITSIGCPMHFDLTNSTIPILTSKKMAWKTCLKELLWFISGSTNNKILQEQGVKIWNLNASREFLDGQNLHNLEENDLGPVYGHQWRHFNAPYVDCKTDYKNQGIDQLKNIIEILKDPKERTSRRIILSAWNPCQLKEMALPPCHVLAHFNVIGENLSCILYQRSGDIGLGVPFNIASYSFLTHLLAKHCNLKAKEFIYYLGNSHIYEEHVDNLKIQMERDIFKFPKINIKNHHLGIDDYKFEDFEIIDYQYNEEIKLKLR